ncbi:hypothetical protein [Ornithinibacillus scapharcae]|uniref:hypothetical protein n=1 Tax=Ornithinibacillus scapharcae TaxID=1147159 RepID=UPI000225B2E1|nr:hypothetical protein [Ornithinibacillus scapharcae]
MENELWRLEVGWLAAYTTDRQVVKNIKRSNKDWKVMAEYMINGKIKATQFKIPVKDRRQAERRFGVKVS